MPIDEINDVSMHHLQVALESTMTGFGGLDSSRAPVTLLQPDLWFAESFHYVEEDEDVCLLEERWMGPALTGYEMGI